VKFIQGDACALPADLGQFGMVLAANLLCRLPKPRLFLDRLASLVVPGGYVVMPSPYTWLEEFTPKSGVDRRVLCLRRLRGEHLLRSARHARHALRPGPRQEHAVLHPGDRSQEPVECGASHSVAT